MCVKADAAVGLATLHATFIIETPGGPLPDLIAENVLGNSAFYAVSLQFKAKIFDGATHLDVHQKGVVTEEDGDLWTKEVVNIKRKY